MCEKNRERQQQTNLLKRDRVSFAGKSSHWINVLVSLKLWLWFMNVFTQGLSSACGSGKWERSSTSRSVKRKSNSYFMFNCHRLCTGSINLNWEKRFILLRLLAHFHRRLSAFTASHTYTGNHANNHGPFWSVDINWAFPANRFMPLWKNEVSVNLAAVYQPDRPVCECARPVCLCVSVCAL